MSRAFRVFRVLKVVRYSKSFEIIGHEIQMIYDEKAAKKAAFEERRKKSE